MSVAFSIVQREPITVLSVQTRTSMRDLPETILCSLAQVGQYLSDHDAAPIGPAFVGYYNLDINNSAVEIGFPVNQSIPGDGEVETRIIPGGLSGVCRYIGPYQELSSAYQQLNAYIESQGRESTGISYEFYLNDPSITPPNELETEIIFPLIQAGSSELRRPSGNGRVHSLFW